MLYEVITPFENILDQEVTHHQRVAPGKDDIAHLGGPLNIGDPIQNIVEGNPHRRATDLTLAGAEPAVGGTGSRNQKQHAIRVTMHDAGDR